MDRLRRRFALGASEEVFEFAAESRRALLADDSATGAPLNTKNRALCRRNRMKGNQRRIGCSGLEVGVKSNAHASLAGERAHINDPRKVEMNAAAHGQSRHISLLLFGKKTHLS